jgi:hypothetical protein
MPGIHTFETRHDLSAMKNLGGKEDLSAAREFYVEWLALPPNRREPASQAKVAVELGVTEQTLRNWKRDPRIIEKVRGKINSVLALNDLSQIVDSLKEQAFDPDNPRSVQAAKVLIGLMETSEQRQIEVPLSEMSMNDLRQLTSDMYDEFDERAETA